MSSIRTVAPVTLPLPVAPPFAVPVKLNVKPNGVVTPTFAFPLTLPFADSVSVVVKSRLFACFSSASPYGLYPIPVSPSFFESGSPIIGSFFKNAPTRFPSVLVQYSFSGFLTSSPIAAKSQSGSSASFASVSSLPVLYLTVSLPPGSLLTMSGNPSPFMSSVSVRAFAALTL